MAVMVTGAGLVGSIAAQILLDKGEDVILYDIAPRPELIDHLVDLGSINLVQGDLLDFPLLVKTIKTGQVERIIHTAGLLTAGVRQNAYAGIRINILGTANVLEVAKLLDLKRIVFCSSSTVYYGSFHRHHVKPIEADWQINYLSDRPTSVYATTKAACEYLGLNYRDLYGVDFVAVRFAGVFGPWKGTPGGLPGRIIKALVEPPVLGQPATLTDPVLLWKGGDEFIYAQDAARSTVKAVFAEKPISGIYNVAMGRLYTMEQVLEIVRNIFPGQDIGTKGEAIGGLGGYPYQRTQPADISLTAKEIDWAPEYDMEKSIRDYADWYAKEVRK